MTETEKFQEQVTTLIIPTIMVELKLQFVSLHLSEQRIQFGCINQSGVIVKE